MSGQSDAIDNTKRPIGPDSFGCLADLREALALAPLDAFAGVETIDALPEDSRRAAYDVAVALGYCRLFGVEPGTEYDGALPRLLAEAAVDVLKRLLSGWSEDAHNLERDWNETDEPIEAEELAIGLVKVRMQAWAADVTISEAYSASLQAGDIAASRLGAALDALSNSFGEFDEELGRQVDWLSIAAGTHLLDNWRALLVEPYAGSLPWWLDGTLESVSERMSAVAQATQPREEAWRQLQQQEPERSLGASDRAFAWVEDMAGQVKRAIGSFLLEPLPSPSLAAGSRPLPISSLPQSESLPLDGGGTLYGTLFQNLEGKVFVTFRSDARQLDGREIILTAKDEITGEQILKVFVALKLNDEGVLSGTFDLSMLNRQHRLTIEFQPAAKLP